MTADDTLTTATNRVASVAAVLDRGVEMGLHEIACLHVSGGGEPLLADCGPDTGPEPQPIIRWSCATKPLIALTAIKLRDAGLISLSDPIGRFVSSADPALQAVPLAALLRHSVTFAGGGDPLAADVWRPWAAIQELMHGIRLDPSASGIGKYSAATAYSFVGRALEVAYGGQLDELVKELTLTPLGLDDTRLRLTGDESDEYVARLRLLRDTSPGQPWRVALIEHSALRTHLWPGIGARGPVTDLAALFEYLLNPERYCEKYNVKSTMPGSASIREMRASQLQGAPRGGDPGAPEKRRFFGLGLRMDARYYPLESGGGTFGHTGMQSSFVFADPKADVVLALLTDGMCGWHEHDARCFQVSTAVYRSLGIG